MGCEKCKGSGKIGVSTPPSGRSADLENGITMVCGGSYVTHPCECVASLPAVDGKATWWTQDGIYSSEIDVPPLQAPVEIAAECEVPRMENGQRVHRTSDNAYYPPMIRLTVPPHDSSMIFANTAREIAAALIAAADACDKADALAVQS